MKVGFTGTRTGMTLRQKCRLLELYNQYDATTLLHGDCLGADAEAHEAFTARGLLDAFAGGYGHSIHIYPPDNDAMRAFCYGRWMDHGISMLQMKPAPYIERNHLIVDKCDVLFAVPATLQEQQRSGTWATVRYARKAGKTVEVLEP